VDVKVMVEKTAEPDPVAAVEALFARIGIPVQLEYASGARFGAAISVLDWFVVIAIGAPIVELLRSINSGGGGGHDEMLTNWFVELIAARGDLENGCVEILDTDGTTVEMRGETSENALHALGDLGWERLRGRRVIWDPESHQWVDRTTVKLSPASEPTDRR
jgi:hypothetical protein